MQPPPKITAASTTAADAADATTRLRKLTLGAPRVDFLDRLDTIAVADLKWRFRVRILGVERVMPMVKHASVSHGETTIRNVPLGLTGRCWCGCGCGAGAGGIRCLGNDK